MDLNFNENESLAAENMNKFLSQFGKVNYKGKEEQRFRLVWSEDPLEKRVGEFARYYGSILLGTHKGVEEVPKYSYIKERYVLEQYYPPEISYSPELPDSKEGSWEPIYVFESGKGYRLPLNQKVLEIIMHGKFNSQATEKERSNRIKAEHDFKEMQATEYFMNSTDTSALQSNLHFGEAVMVPKEYNIESPNLRNKVQ